MTWWQRSWWVLVDNGPHLRTARGRRRAWRAATRAAREMRVWRDRKGERLGKWRGRENNTLHIVLHLPTNTSPSTQQPKQRQQQQQQQPHSTRQRDCVPAHTSAIGAQLHSERVIAVRESELRFHPLVNEVCERNVLSGFRVHSNIPKSEAPAQIDFTTGP